jgi:hypothetical protein
MKQEKELSKLYILHKLVGIPKKILASHDIENLTELVLHELCDKNCLDFERAAYFVDNPDFNFFKGITGIDRFEIANTDRSHWDDLEEFTVSMRKSPFNNTVRSMLHESAQRRGEQEEKMASNLAKELKFTRPGYYTWDMKHGNKGFLLYQEHQEKKGDIVELIPNAVCLLGLCPIGY